ncbi:MAG: hypothetical protein MZV65_54540 [Chromatiales bacterium]|nr:hypothetical protein [Chromatiales bacterium]
MFSVQGIMEMVKALAKFPLVGAIARTGGCGTVRRRLPGARRDCRRTSGLSDGRAPDRLVVPGGEPGRRS